MLKAFLNIYDQGWFSEEVGKVMKDAETTSFENKEAKAVTDMVDKQPDAFREIFRLLMVGDFSFFF